MKNITKALTCTHHTLARLFFAGVLLCIVGNTIQAQCVPIPNSIAGEAFLDEDFDGFRSVTEGVQSNVLVTAYDRDGQIAGSDITDNNGYYLITELTEGENYQIIFEHTTGLDNGHVGNNNRSAVQYHNAPACEVSFGLSVAAPACGSNPQIAGICFVQGSVEAYPDLETIVGLESSFNNTSDVVKYASHKETGSIWGLAWKGLSDELFSSAFVKQSAWLKDGPYAIFKTNINDVQPTTTKYADVNELLNGKLSGLTVTNQEDCSFGDQVGRIGLGNLIISPDQSRLYTTVLENNTVVSISTVNPTSSNTKEYQIPRPSGIDVDAEYRVFALKWHGNKIYVGATVTGTKTNKEADSRAVVFEMDPVTGDVQEIFSTNYIRGFWQDAVPDAFSYAQWLTDLEFTADGLMLLSLSDRLGHRFCKLSTGNRLDQQFPDLLAVWYDDASNEWKLESNGKAGNLSGSGIDNGQGPDGGEFFGNEFWPAKPNYHNETALGSILVIPGSSTTSGAEEVIVAVYDPIYDSYSGGYHRYNTTNGAINGAKQLYTNEIVELFGKATGFGDMASLCEPSMIEIGNYAWFDENADGIQNAGEQGIKELPLNLYNDQCELIGTTTTDANGYYIFNSENVEVGVFPGSTYFVEIDNAVYDEETTLYTVGTNEYSICVAGNGDNNALDCDILEATNQCNLYAFIEVNIISTNHTFDIGLAPPSGFDLALTKSIIGNKYIKKNEPITFKITVFNQGGQSAGKVDIVDYLPTGYTFNPNENQGWTQNGNKLTTTIVNSIKPNKQEEIYLTLRATAGIGIDHVNVAEIAQSYTLDGKPVADIDSTPDDNPTNDNGGIANGTSDDMIDNDGSIDEDDHDPALPSIFDLAIRVVLNEDRVYVAGDLVKFDITVYNQGNTVADIYDVTQYADLGLAFDINQNSGWEIVEGKPTLSIDENLEPGEQRSHCIIYKVKDEINNGFLSSYSEISYSIPVGGGGNFDFDSTPDNVEDNDKGANANTPTDNFLQGTGIEDEDDHDIVLVSSKYADLALRKTVNKEKVKPGEIVTFDIEIINQGTQPVDKVEIIDYLPEGLELDDPAWQMHGDNTAILTLNMNSPLQQNESRVVSIRTKIDPDIKAGSLVNNAEIFKMYFDGDDMSDKDIDSTPDDNFGNDPGGVPTGSTDNTISLDRLIDEDDQDPAIVYVITSELVGTTCLRNATSTDDGQYLDQFKISGPTGDTWIASVANNYYLDNSGTALPLEVVMTGDDNNVIFTEMEVGDGQSMYTVSLIRLDGEVGDISFRNEDDEVQTYSLGPDNYTETLIEGEIALCNGGTEIYNLVNPVDGVVYEWTLPGEGVFVGSSTGTSVTVNWDGATRPAYHELEVSAVDACIEPGMVTISNGAGSGAMFCLGSMNLSLDADCRVTVTPSMVLSGGVPAGTAFSVMLTDHHGEAIPNATLTSEHIGMTVTAKVIDGCSGNSCWSTILVEDKLKPTILCQDDEIFCNKVDQYPGPIAEDNCGGVVMMQMLQNQFSKINDCDSEFIGQYARSYQAEDSEGNKSEICDIIVKVKRADLHDVTFPLDMEVSCNNFATDEDGNPDPFMTGRPVYRNDYVWPNNDMTQGCDIVTLYDDILLPNDGTSLGGVIKVMRTWKVYEWCAPEFSKTHTQLIEIKDIEAPIITACPQDMTISATGGNCEATFTLPLPEAYDSCVGTNLQYVTEYNGLTVLNGESRVVTLPFSNTPYTITYTVRDDAGNPATCTSKISVVDDVAPLVVCDAHTVVSLNDNGDGYVYAGTLDDGSTDACGIDSMKVIRMDAAGVCGNANDQFADRVFFCCEDVGRENMVQLVVWDMAGNSNSCMVTVLVQDKAKPELETLADEVVECGTDIYPLSQYGTPATNDACGVTLTQDSSIMLNTCGSGDIIRTFTATDGTNTVTTTQTITVVNSDPFDPFTDVTFVPEDYTVDGMCDMNQLHPDSLPYPYGRPEYNYDDCDMVGIAYEDDMYPTPTLDNTCFKIVRTYTITDWCQEDDDNFEERKVTQTIKVTNSVKPTIVAEDNLNFNTEDCDEGSINLTATGSDDCSMGAALRWEAVLDYDQDGIATGDFDVAPVSGTGSTATVSGVHPVGTHYVQWTFTDACGNVETALRTFTISNSTEPVFPCLNLSVGLTAMDLDNDGTFDTEMACFNIDTMLNLVPPGSIYHPCGNDFELSLSAESIVKKDTFDCSHVGVVQIITAYAIDEFGNISECVFEIDVQDNNTEEVCVNVKSCTVTPDGGTLVANTDCEGTAIDNSFDVSILPDNTCGPMTITHNYSVAGDAGYTGTNDNTTLEGAVFPEGETTVTWFIAITSMNTVMGQCDVIITVVDETAPTFTNCDNTINFTDDSDNNLDCQHTNPNVIDPSTDDNCDDTPTLTHDYNVTGDIGYTGTNDNTTLTGAVFPLGMTVVTWTATDAAGNSSTCTTTINVSDDNDPMLTCSSDDLVFEDLEDGLGNCQYTIDEDITFTGTDACDGDILATHNYNGTINNTTLQGGVFPVGTTTVVFTVTDLSGNTATCEVVIMVLDNNPPSIVCPDDVTVDAGSNCQYVQPDGDLDATAMSPCAGNAPVTHDYSVAGDAGYTGTNNNTTLEGAVFDIGTITITFSATNGELTETCTIDITVDDGDPPSLTCASPTTVNSNDDGDDDCIYTNTGTSLDPTVDDNCDNNPTLVHNVTGVADQSSLDGVEFGVGTTTVVWTATDNSGNSSTCEVVVIVIDNVNPELTCETVLFEFDDTDDGTNDCAHTVQAPGISFNGTDNCDGVIAATHNYTGAINNTNLEGASFPVGDTEVVFTVTDANNNTATCTITVRVGDTTNPTINCGDDVTANADENCTHTITNKIADPSPEDACGILSIFHNYEVAGDAGYTGTNDNTTLEGAVFPKGETIVTWLVSDNSNLTATCQVTITVEDNTPAECIAQDTAVVSIGLDGHYILSTGDLSNLLDDNCDDMELTYSFTPDSLFCEMAGDTLTAIFTATDSSGNVSANCPLVVVINESATAQCNPIDITVNLDEGGQAMITPDDVNNIGSSICDDTPVVTIDRNTFLCNDAGPNDVTITVIVGTDTTTCVAVVTVVDTLTGPTLVCADNAEIGCEELNANFGGSVQAWMDDTPGITATNDNCPESPENMYTRDTSYVFNPNTCGFGQSTRTITITDAFGNSDQCTQLFTVDGPDDLITQAEIDALIPAMVTITDCIDPTTVLPGTNGVGEITATIVEALGECTNVTVTFEDDIDLGPNGGMCNSTITRVWTIIDACQQPDGGEFTFTQTIVIIDETGPELLDGSDIIASTSTSENCQVFVSFAGLMFNDCNSVTYDDPSGVFTVGDYEVIINSTDACGNTGIDTVNLQVRDDSDLQLICNKQFPIIMNDANPMAMTVASDYVTVESSSTCSGEITSLLFSFSSTDINDTIKFFGCETVTTPVDNFVYWYDLDGNLLDSCFVATAAEDPDMLCTGNFVAGTIVNELGAGLPSFEVNLNGAGIMNESSEFGRYAFPSMPTGGTYEVAPGKDGDDRAGVNTLDLVKIQRHVLGLDILDSPYKLIAADINNDERVNGADLLSLRKLLLGLTPEFINNTSWRSVDAEYVFPDPTDPWVAEFPETYYISSLESSMNIDFIGVKIGDVDNSLNFDTEDTEELEFRSIDNTIIILESETNNLVNAVAGKSETIYGIQMTLSVYDLSLTDIKSDMIGEANIDLVESLDGGYNVIITIPDGLNVREGDVLFKLSTAGNVKNLSRNIYLDSKSELMPEAYIGSELEISAIDLRYGDMIESASDLLVTQNRPNPWSDVTSITVQIPISDKVSMSMYDMNGRLLKTTSKVYEAGIHTLEINNQDLPQAGVYYYQIDYRSNSKQYKMIKID